MLIPKLEWEREIRRLGHGFRWGPLGVGPSDVAAGDRPARGWAWSEPAEIDSNRLRRTREPLLGTPRGLTQRGIGDGHLVFAVPGSAIIHVPFTVVYGALLTTCCTTRALRRLGKMLGSGPRLFFCVPIPSAGNLLPYSAPLVSHPLPPPRTHSWVLTAHSLFPSGNRIVASGVPMSSHTQGLTWSWWASKTSPWGVLNR